MMWSYNSVTTELNLRASGAYISKFTNIRYYASKTHTLLFHCIDNRYDCLKYTIKE